MIDDNININSFKSINDKPSYNIYPVFKQLYDIDEYFEIYIDSNNICYTSVSSNQQVFENVYIKDLVNELKLVQKDIVNDILNKGLKILAVNTELNVGGNNVAGLFNEDNNCLLINCNQIREFFLHELSHAIDYNNNSISLDESFLKIYSEEKNNIIPDNSYLNYEEYKNHIVSSPKEFFAECSSKFFKNDEYFMEIYPKTFDYISNYYNNYDFNKIRIDSNEHIK